MTDLPERKRVFAPKTKSGCKTCRARRVKCDERRPVCQKCETYGKRRCEWSDIDSNNNSSSYSTPSHSSTDTRVILPRVKGRQDIEIFQPPSLADGLSQTERHAVGFFLCRTARDLGWSFPSSSWLTLSIQLGYQEPSLRYAVAALGMMHQARQPFSHTSLHPVIDDRLHRQALSFYSKSLSHLRTCIDHNAGKDRTLATSIALLSCLLYFCFEQLSGDVATACLHMKKGNDMVADLRKAPRALTSEPLGDDTISLFAGFDNANFTVVCNAQAAPTRAWSTSDRIPGIPPVFDSMAEANEALQKLEAIRVGLQNQLLALADESLKSLGAFTSDLAVEHCVRHTLSKTVHLDDSSLANGLHNLIAAYGTWRCALACSMTATHGYPRATAVMEMQAIGGVLTLQTCRQPQESVFHTLEDELDRILDLAESCLLSLDTGDSLYLGATKTISGEGYGLALSTDLLAHVHMVGVKSRRTATRLRAVELLRATDKSEKVPVYHNNMLCDFIRRITRHEEEQAARLHSRSLKPGHASQDIPSEARFSDVVVSQILYRPGCINLICTRFTSDETGEMKLEVLEDTYNILNGMDVSRRTHVLDIPAMCQIGARSSPHMQLLELSSQPEVDSLTHGLLLHSSDLRAGGRTQPSAHALLYARNIAS